LSSKPIHLLFTLSRVSAFIGVYAHAYPVSFFNVDSVKRMEGEQSNASNNTARKYTKLNLPKSTVVIVVHFKVRKDKDSVNLKITRTTSRFFETCHYTNFKIQLTMTHQLTSCHQNSSHRSHVVISP
jgi:hypothetical protein